MSIEELKKKFIVTDDYLSSRLESLVVKALNHCVVTEKGVVHINKSSLSAKDKIKLALAARSLAAGLDINISAEMSVEELVNASGLPSNQVHARSKDLINERFAQSSGRGMYKANPHKIEPFLDSLT